MADLPGVSAASPWVMPWSAWKQVLARTWSESSDDNVGLIAAGVAFYGFLALVPLLGAIVLSYGLVADPSTVMANMTQLTAVMPVETAKLIGEQLMNLVETSGEKKGVGLFVALAIALFGARNGAGAIVTALNIAYEEKEKRGFLLLNLLALAITAAAVAVAITALIAIAALGHLREFLPNLPDWASIIGKLLSYLVFATAAAAAAATLYRFGPSRERARWVWMTPGSLFTSLMWLLLTLGFGTYVANFGSYDATYGSLGTVVVLLTWLYLSSYILLFGAELNSEFEHQTARDSTTGAEEPAGARGAWVADHVPDDQKDKDRPASVDASPAGLSAGTETVVRFATVRATSRGAQVAGFGSVDVLSSAMASFGLARIRRGRRPLQGLALLAGAGLLTWLRRQPALPQNLVKAVLFDLDGTLVDSNDFHIEVWREVFGSRGHEISAAAIQQQIGKGGDQLIPSLIAGVEQREVDDMSQQHGEIFKARFLGRVRPFPGARDLLAEVHRRGQRVILASSASQADVDFYIDLLDASELVDASTSIDDVKSSKPEPDIFTSALKKAGIAAGEAVVVGDTPYDIEAAARCGIPAVAVRSGKFEDAELVGAVALFDDVASILKTYAASPLLWSID